MLRSQSNPDGFGFEVTVECLAPQVSAKARSLKAAEGRTRIVRVVRVDPDGTGANRLDRAVRLLEVSRPNAGGEAVDGVIRELHARFEIIKRQHRKYRPEDLFARDRHLRGHRIENCSLDVITLAV